MQKQVYYYVFLSQLKEKIVHLIRYWNCLCDTGLNLIIISFIQHYREIFHFVFKLTELGKLCGLS